MAFISANNEWSPLKSVIVGRATYSNFPSEPQHMIANTMPEAYIELFRPNNPFPEHICKRADAELDQLASILHGEGIKVYRPNIVNWQHIGGYTGSMPRDGLITIGNHIIESAFAWNCRRQEIELAYGGILRDLALDASVKVIRAPKPPVPNTIYDDIEDNEPKNTNTQTWTINNTRPAFDAADFMRFGATVIGQYSHVTNQKGVEYLNSQVPTGYSVSMLETTNPHAMHIDTVILPLRQGLLVYHPGRVSEESLRKQAVLADWDLRPVPFTPKPRLDPPSYTCSDWLVMIVLVLDGRKVIVDETDTEFAAWMEELGKEPIFCPLRHVNSIGGASHCATVDLVREG
ncbi:MAG: hypothetical protein Q9226_006153 [Calogaya cf. arnoldii]